MLVQNAQVQIVLKPSTNLKFVLEKKKKNCTSIKPICKICILMRFTTIFFVKKKYAKNNEIQRHEWE